MLHNKRARQPWLQLPPYLCESLESRTLLSTAGLVKDINTATLGNVATPLGRLGSTVIFAENDGVHGVELYKTDGTAAGTSMVKDIAAGSANGVSIVANATNGVAFNGAVYFTSTAGGFYSLWKTDGTAAGTVMVKQIANQATDFAATTTRLFFNVATAPGQPKTLWVSDGTAAGTATLSQVAGTPALSTAATLIANNKLLFTGQGGTASYFYSTDGTQAGTVLLKSVTGTFGGIFSAGARYMALAATTSGTDIWTSDGTANGTSILSSYAAVASFGSGTSCGYFVGELQGGNRYSLYSTNGTTAGTTLVLGGFTGARPGMSTLTNGVELFDATVNTVYFVYRSDGTAAGTFEIGAIDTPNFGPFAAYDAGSVAIFAGVNSTVNPVLWKTDGTVAGTTEFAISPIDVAGPSAFLAGSPIYFSDDDGTHGQELWKSDGTAAGTVLVADIDLQPTSSTPVSLSAINGKLWFDAYDNIHGYQPWVCDGTAAGTVQVSTDPYTTFPGNTFVGLGTKAFTIGTYNLSTTRLYYSTGSGVTQAANAAGQPSTGVALPTLFNNAVYMGGSDGSSYGIWKTDGTQTGTALAATTSVAKFASNLVASGNFLYFDGKNNGVYEIYSMSTTGQVTQLTSLASPTTLMGTTAAYNNKFYFIVNTSAGSQLWRSDGSAGGTLLVEQLSNTINTAYQMVVTNGVLYLLGGGGLYKSDGTAAGTFLVASVNTYSPVQMVGANGNLFFTAADPATGNQVVWFSDGTPADTRLLMPNLFYNPGVAQLTVAGNLLYFIATDPTHGSELWQSDGTVEGTQVIDINPGSASGMPFNNSYTSVIQAVGNVVYVSADDGIHGIELQRVYNQDTITGTAAADTITLTQDTTHKFINWQIGASSGQLPINDPSGLTINGNGSTDAINLVTTNGDAIPGVLHLNGTFTINGLSNTDPLAGTTLDIGSSTVFITYTGPAVDPLSAIRGYLKNGYNANTWTGAATATTGAIQSTAAAADVNHTTGIGYADSADGLVPLPANTIELKYTLYGDTGLTGTVGFTDFMRMTQNFTTTTGATWGQGDFNYDGAVDTSDFNLLKPNYGIALPAPVPERVPVMTPIVVAPVSTGSTSLPTLTTISTALVDSTSPAKHDKHKPAAKKSAKHGH